MSDSNGNLPAAPRPRGVPTAVGMLGKAAKIKGLERVSDRQLGLRPRELRIIHSIRKRNDLGRPGQFRLDREVFDDITVVLLSVQGYRTLLEGTEQQARTVCASADGERPLATVPVPRNTDCPSCEYAQWRDPAPGKDKRRPPLCSENYAFLGIEYDYADALPFYFLCRKTAAIAARNFLQEANARPHVGAIEEMVVQLTLKEEKSPAGGLVWYTPIFTIVREIDASVYGALAALAAQTVYTPRVDMGVSAATAEDEEPPPDVAPPEAPPDGTDLPF